MIRVFHIISHFNMGGAEQVALNISESNNSDIEYHIVELMRGHSRLSKTYIKELKENDIKYHRFIIPDINFHFLFERLAATIFPLWFIFIYLKYKPSIIHTHTEAPDIATWIFFKIFRIRKCHIVRTIHNTRLWTGQEKLGKHIEPFFQSHKANIAISQAVQHSYKGKYNECPPTIDNGVAPIKQITFPKLVSNKKNILFAGRFEEQKGIKELIKVIKAIEKNGEYFFHIVGDGSLKDYITQSVTGLQNVRIYKPIYGISKYLSSFDYLFMPSIFEGLSILALEAGINRLPIIANNAPGLKEILPYDWALLASNGKTHEYIHIFNEIIPNINREEIATTIYNYVSTNFLTSNMRDGYEKLYTSHINA